MNTIKRCIRTFGLAAAMMLLAVGAGWGQSDVQVRVGQLRQGGVFFVDNVAYSTDQVFRWRINEVHQIRFVLQQSLSDPAVGLNNPTPIGPATDAGLGVRYVVSSTPIATEGPPPSADFLRVTTQMNGGSMEASVRVQVYDGLRSITIQNEREYRIRLRTPASGCAPSINPGINQETCNQGTNNDAGYLTIECPGPGDARHPRATNGDFWCVGGPVRISAVPNIGYAFRDWNSYPSIPGSAPLGSGVSGASGSATFVLSTPMDIQVNFGPAKFYRLRTQPPGLDVLVDRNIARTRQIEPQVECRGYLPEGINPPSSEVNQDYPYYETCVAWLVGSTKLLSTPGATQRDETGRGWVFDRWVPGGVGQNFIFSVSGENLATDLITAVFVRAGGVTFNTLPIGAPIEVNGRTWPSANHWFGLNSKVQFAAPAEFVDKQGKRWRFRGWSNGRPAAQELTITDEIVEKGLYLTAVYDPLNRVTIETNPSGLPLTVDGRDCPAPCMVERLALESAVIGLAPSVVQRDVLRLEFDNWSDGIRLANRSVGFGPEFQRLIANYRPLYRFTALGNPREGVTFAMVPDSGDGFYDVGTRVTVTARALPGFRFRRWGGDTAGQFPSATVTLGGPRTVVAELEVIPFLDPAGVQNTAGTGPQDQGDIGRVSAGSLITVTGVNLTPLEETGPRSPMVQSLAGLLVRVGEQLLPLSFASATQVNAQLPYNLPEGPQKLSVSRVGQPDVSADFEVVRNAPGLFSQFENPDETQPPFAFALKANGSTVTTANPAVANEVISLLGTGLGPFRNNPPLGFAVPSGMEFVLADSVEVLVGDQVVQPLRVIATPGFVGMTSVQIRVGAQFNSGQSPSLRVRVNGKESNTVRLPIR